MVGKGIIEGMSHKTKTKKNPLYPLAEDSSRRRGLGAGIFHLIYNLIFFECESRGLKNDVETEVA